MEMKCRGGRVELNGAEFAQRNQKSGNWSRDLTWWSLMALGVCDYDSSYRLEHGLQMI